MTPTHQDGRHREPFDGDVVVGPGRLAKAGRLSVPARPRGLVLFVHGRGGNRRSPPNRFVAARLRESGIATLLFDLLADEEVDDTAIGVDVELLAVRLLVAAALGPAAAGVDAAPLGFFGAGTGAAAALLAAAEDPSIAAVVTRGGRIEPVAAQLTAVFAPTLLIVGGADPVVREQNAHAARRLRCEHRLVVVPGATHRFEEPGALDDVARLSASWYADHFVDPDVDALRGTS